MTSTVGSAQELLEAGDLDFAALLTVWEMERQCPLPLVDLLIERGLEKQSRAALWAATTEKRKKWNSAEWSYPYPYCSIDSWYWVTRTGGFCDCVPDGHLSEKYAHQLWNYTSPTLRGALVGLLDNWLK